MLSTIDAAEKAWIVKLGAAETSSPCDETIRSIGISPAINSIDSTKAVTK